RSELLQRWLVRMRAGDKQALDELIRHLGDRLQRLTHQMLNGHPAVKRWAQTDDVLQGALLRLLRAVQNVQPDSMRAFLGLPTRQIRWRLIARARHYYGPEGAGAHHASLPGDHSGEQPHYDGPDNSTEPSSLAEWREFHQKIDELPEDEREVVGLV